MGQSDESAEKAADARRVYYDHEPAWSAIAAAGGRSWQELPDEFRWLCDDAAEASAYAALDRFLTSRWAPVAGARALDLGCGSAQSTLRLVEHGLEAIGVDYSETAVELARDNAEQAEANCEFEVADVVDLARFDDDRFDLVVDNHCLHCLVEPDDRSALLREAERVLRPGGVFFSETMSRDGGFDAQKFHANPETFIAEARTRIWVSKLELDEELREAGFNVVQTYSRRQPGGFGYNFVNIALAR